MSGQEQIPCIVNRNSVTIFLDMVPNVIDSTHGNFDKIVEAIREKDWDSLPSLMSMKRMIEDYSRGEIEIKDGILIWKGIIIENFLVDRIFDMLEEGFDVDPMLNFLDNLMQNPSKSSIDELYSFMEYGNLPITPDGYFLAYKKIRADWTDIHSGTMDNNIGETVKMLRGMVCEDKNKTCSDGLHFCSHEYLDSFGRSSGDRTVVLKINPRDVVSIPADYNNTKGRCCEYQVVSELGGVKNAEEAKQHFNKSVMDFDNSDDDGSPLSMSQENAEAVNKKWGVDAEHF